MRSLRPIVLAVLAAALSLAGTGPIPASAQSGIGTMILVDQFGYPPTASKVAIVINQPPATLEVRRVGADDVVFSARSVMWNGGAVDPASGDSGSRFDFSSVTAVGEYEIVNPATGGRSDRFAISDDVYDELLDTALRAFFLNRANTNTFTGGPSDVWAGPAALIGPGQDTEARWVDDPSRASERDLSGGWYDAGDTNKYVTFAAAPVHQLLGAYANHPHLFRDDVGITESGNGVPDVLDEVRWELEWVERMQDPDGGVLLKVGFTDWNGAALLEDDRRPRFYEEACSSSTIAAASMFAAGARAFETIDPAFASRLETRAIDAWEWVGSNPWRDDCDPQIVHAGDADRSLDQQRSDHVVAAVHLFALTGEQRFHEVIDDGLETLLPFVDSAFGRYEPAQAIAIELYRSLPNARPALVAAIDQRVAQVRNDGSVHGDTDVGLYRWHLPSDQFHWGSNMVLANTGGANLTLARLAPGDDDDLFARAGAHLSAIHGVNPLTVTYLSNMSSLGAEHSVTQLYHFRYGDGSAFDDSPAPGFLVGGPNSSYSGQLADALDKPPARSYADDNTVSDMARTWELSEPAIYYQSAYVSLLVGVIDTHTASLDEGFANAPKFVRSPCGRCR